MKPMKSDPWYKATYAFNSNASQLSLHVPHDVFSTLRIDEGTLLLLDHLPAGNPGSVLDMGCGYGALGLPVARRFPNARVEMVDRDLLAVSWSEKNALANQITNVVAHGSLGYRDITPSGGAPYDWILCNVPARIGRPFILNLFEAGLALLAPGGEIRVVVIRDLAPLLLEIKEQHSWPLTEIAQGPRHSIFSLAKTPGQTETQTPQDLYLRDTVEIGGLRLDRPFDLGGDDPKRLSVGLPVLLDALPRQAPGNVLCFRSGYGVLPLVSRTRWPQAKVTAIDRDLLATTFISRNARTLGLAGELLEIRENAHLPDALRPQDRFDLIVGELSPSAGERIAEDEILALSKKLAKGGQALLLTLDKLEKQWIRPLTNRHPLSINRMISRDGYSVMLLTGGTPR